MRIMEETENVISGIFPKGNQINMFPSKGSVYQKTNKQTTILTAKQDGSHAHIAMQICTSLRPTEESCSVLTGPTERPLLLHSQ